VVESNDELNIPIPTDFKRDLRSRDK